MKKPSKAHRFYQNEYFALTLGDLFIVRALRHQNLLLAECSGDANDLTKLLTTDAMNSVLMHVGCHTTKTFSYAPFGHSATDTLGRLLAFNGEPLNRLDMNYLLGNGYRAFNPRIMRFQSSDSDSPFGEGGINCYSYCGGDSVNSSDPSGHQPRPLTRPPVFTKSPLRPTTQRTLARSRSGPVATQSIGWLELRGYSPRRNPDKMAKTTSSMSSNTSTQNAAPISLRNAPRTSTSEIIQNSSEAGTVIQLASPQPIDSQNNSYLSDTETDISRIVVSQIRQHGADRAPSGIFFKVNKAGKKRR